jgi:RNA recognition motif-containing protein
MNIFVGSLHYDINEADLKEIFEEYGAVSSVKIITDKFTGKSKGFGFVEMANAEEAKKAIEELNEAELEGRKMVVNEALEKKDDRKRPNNNRGGGSGGYQKREGGYKPRS